MEIHDNWDVEDTLPDLTIDAAAREPSIRIRMVAQGQLESGSHPRPGGRFRLRTFPS